MKPAVYNNYYLKIIIKTRLKTGKLWLNVKGVCV